MTTCMLKAAEVVSPEKQQASVWWETLCRFGSFSGFGQLTEAQSQVVCCVFGCNWWARRHYGCRPTGHIHSWRWWEFDCHWGSMVYLWWILQSTWIIWTKCCKATKKLSHSIMTAYTRSSWSSLYGRHNFQVVSLLIFPVCSTGVHPELILTWLGTKIRSRDYCESSNNSFRFFVNLRQISQLFARNSQSAPLICQSTSNLK